MLLLPYILFVIAPIVFWFWFFNRQDRAEPEPKKLLIQIFLLGIGLTIFAALVEDGLNMLLFPHQYQQINLKDIMHSGGQLSAIALFVSVLAGFIEESLKFLTLREFVYSKVDFNQIADGFFYAVTLSLGFSVAENTLYFYNLYHDTPTLAFMVLVSTRGIFTTLLHITATGITGIAMGKCKFSPTHDKRILYLGLGLAILLHGSFNLLISLPYGALFAFLLVFLVFVYLIRLLHKPQSRAVWRLIKPQTINSNPGL